MREYLFFPMSLSLTRSIFMNIHLVDLAKPDTQSQDISLNTGIKIFLIGRGATYVNFALNENSSKEIQLIKSCCIFIYGPIYSREVILLLILKYWNRFLKWCLLNDLKINMLICTTKFHHFILKLRWNTTYFWQNMRYCVEFPPLI